MTVTKIKRVPPKTREEVAQIMGMTVERVRQIEEHALMKAYTYLKKRGLSLQDLTLS